MVAPTLVAFNSPPENSNIVGIPRIPYFVGVLGSLSILCFAMITSLAISSEISSKLGPICLHGPHHSANPSLEPSHAFAEAIKIAPKLSKDTIIKLEQLLKVK